MGADTSKRSDTFWDWARGAKSPAPSPRTPTRGGGPQSVVLWLVAIPMALTVLQRALSRLQLSSLLDAIVTSWRTVSRILWEDFFSWLGPILKIDIVPAPPQFDALTFGALLLGSSLNPLRMFQPKSTRQNELAEPEVISRFAVAAFLMITIAFVSPTFSALDHPQAQRCTWNHVAQENVCGLIPTVIPAWIVGLSIPLFIAMAYAMFFYFSFVAGRRPIYIEPVVLAQLLFAIGCIVFLAYLMADPYVYLQATGWAGEPQWQRYGDFVVASKVVMPAITVLITVGFLLAAWTNQRGLIRIVVMAAGIAIADRLMAYAEFASPDFAEATERVTDWIDSVVTRSLNTQ